jgi:lysine-N-methylase
MEMASGDLPEMDEALERYYLVKLNSLQFCGPPNFGLPILAGLESLILTLPMILWLRRSFTDLEPAQGVARAIQIVDDHFGGDPMLGLPYIQYLMRKLTERREVEKLVAWYSR